MVHVAVINLGEKVPLESSTIDPKKNLRVQTVRNVAIAMLAELKAIVSGLFVIRTEEKKPSIAANRIAASPSKKRSARKTKTSESEM